MDIRDLTEQSFVDIFADPITQTGDQNADVARQTGFRMQDQDTNLFDNNQSTTTTTTISATTETTTLDPSTTNTTTLEPNADILGGGDTGKVGRKPKYDFSDASGYFEDRFKNGKFVAVTETLEDGTERPFIPKTPEEFDEVIDIQVNYRLDEERKGLDKNWYESKSPAWQTVARYAEMTSDPAELIPFIQGVKTIDSVAQINENEIDGAEKIVRTRLEQRGEPEDVIDEQIESLKTTDKLVSTAQKYKPLIVKEEQQQLQQMVQRKQQQEQQMQQLVASIRENAIKSIETPLFGKIKLKQDEKNLVYSLIGEPDQNSGGYRIYSELDSLFEKGDFDTLKQVALLLAKKDSYLGYVNTNAANQVAGDLQKKLRIASDSRGSQGNNLADDVDDERKVVSRNQYNRTPRFGRG